MLSLSLEYSPRHHGVRQLVDFGEEMSRGLPVIERRTQ